MRAIAYLIHTYHGVRNTFGRERREVKVTAESNENPNVAEVYVR
jgi:hypothetical protein